MSKYLIVTLRTAAMLIAFAGIDGARAATSLWDHNGSRRNTPLVAREIESRCKAGRLSNSTFREEAQEKIKIVAVSSKRHIS
jgi:hypothetical protein